MLLYGNYGVNNFDETLQYVTTFITAMQYSIIMHQHIAHITLYGKTFKGKPFAVLLF